MNKDERKNIKEPAEQISAGEQRIEFQTEAAGDAEKREALTPEESAIKEELKREIDMIEYSGDLKEEAEEKAKKIGSLDEERKLKHLLEIAKHKGLFFALRVAKDMKDPYVLDVFHDLLVRDGLYKKFAK